MSASTVLSVGFRMSISRLCVRSSNWSRASLSECGDTSSVKRSILVGSGTGPFTVAPVRLAVSTISRAELSMRRWSNAFKRMRMFWLAMTSALLEDLGDDAGADGLATLSDGEAQAFFHRNRADQLDVNLDVVSRHDHLSTSRQLDRSGHI